MRSDDDGPVGKFGNGREEFVGVLREGGQGIGIKHGCGTAGEDGADLGAGFRADACGGANADGIPALVVEEHSKRQSIIGLRQHDCGGVGGVDKQLILMARDGDKPCPDFQCGLCRKAGSARVEFSAGDDNGMAAFVFVGCWSRSWGERAWSFPKGADLISGENVSGMPMSATTTSPQSMRPGIRRWPGFLRKKVMVRSASHKRHGDGQ